jgi:hypothetical protein
LYFSLILDAIKLPAFSNMMVFQIYPLLCIAILLQFNIYIVVVEHVENQTNGFNSCVCLSVDSINNKSICEGV